MTISMLHSGSFSVLLPVQCYVHLQFMPLNVHSPFPQPPLFPSTPLRPLNALASPHPLRISHTSEHLNLKLISLLHHVLPCSTRSRTIKTFISISIHRGVMKVMDAATYGGTAEKAPGASEGARPLNRTHSKSSSQNSTKFVGGEEETNYDGGGDNRRRGILHRKKH